MTDSEQEKLSAADLLVRKIKDNMFVSILLVAMAAIIGLATLTDSIQGLISFFSPPSEPVPQGPVTRKAPSEIASYVRSRTPYEQETSSGSYSGIPVDWSLVYETLSLETETIFFQDAEESIFITCEDVNFSMHPEFKAAESGDLFQVVGVIVEVDSMRISLEKCGFSGIVPNNSLNDDAANRGAR